MLPLAITIWIIPPLVIAGAVVGVAIAYGVKRLVLFNERHWEDITGQQMTQSQSQTRAAVPSPRLRVRARPGPVPARPTRGTHRDQKPLCHKGSSSNRRGTLAP